MKFTKYIIAIFCCVLVAINMQAKVADGDSTKFKATPDVLLFMNFHQGLCADSKETNFDIKRACFGYYFQVPKGFSARIRFDVSPLMNPGLNLNKISIFLRHAYMSYKTEKLTLNFGLVDNYQHQVQERFWSRRYIFRSFIDEYKLLPVIDLGFNGSYAFNEKVSLEFGIMSGQFHDEDSFYGKYYYSLGVNYFPIEKLKLKAYSTYSFQGDDLYTMGAFVGYSIIPQLSIGAEYNAKFSPSNVMQSGVSAVINGDVIKDKLNLFFRYDWLDSNISYGYTPDWTVLDSGYGFITGIEWKIIKYVRLSLNYQSWFSTTQSQYLFLNLEFRY